MKPVRPMTWLLVAAALAVWAGPDRVRAAPSEIRVYQGRKLHPFHRSYDNSIRGPQKVDKNKLRFRIDGLVAAPLTLTYDQVLKLPRARRVVKMPCVEGWHEILLYDGIRLVKLIEAAKPKPGIKTVIFRAADGYTSSLPYEYVKKNDLLLGFMINGLVLDKNRGFPFQVVAPGKLGYKWVKWVVGITLTDKPYRGYWERRGYSNQADAPR
jgi:DMSO/TMAO reductase YedYZ molybdopterin-dependent catalytic subunit